MGFLDGTDVPVYKADIVILAYDFFFFCLIISYSTSTIYVCGRDVSSVFFTPSLYFSCLFSH